MNIEQLHYFLQVVESGSVNAAAQKFYMTPQAVNASIRKLEEEYDSPFLIRSKKGVSLTPQVHLFAAYAKEIIEKNKKIHLVLHAYNNQDVQLSGTASVFSASIYTEIFLPRVLRDFKTVFPNTNIKLATVNSADALSHFFGGYCDIAFLTAGKDYLENALQEYGNETTKMIPLLSDSIVLCANPYHPLIGGGNITSEELAAYIQTTNAPISFFHILTLRYEGIQYQNAISDAGSAELHKMLMLENNVITCMPRMAYYTLFQNDGFAAIPLNHVDNTLHAVLYRDNPSSENHQLILHFVQSLQKQFEQRYGVYKAQ